MNWQKSIGLLLAGAGLVVLTLWFTTPSGTQAPSPVPTFGKKGATNASIGGKSPARPTGTNVARTGVQTPGAARTGVRTNAPSLTRTDVARAGTNAPSITERVREWSRNPAFYPIVAAIPIGLGVILLLLSGKKKAETAQMATGTGARPVLKVRRRASTAAVHQCNVLHIGVEGQTLWQFTGRGGRFSLAREQSSKNGNRVASLGAKDWTALWQRKLNVAWLPSDQVFLRVLHLPQAELSETVSMVEFQMEKLSPMPVNQVVWSIQAVPYARENTQTLVVMIVARSVVEEFLGKLETEGYLADRLELPILDQLQATEVDADGAWVFPAPGGSQNTALVAWFYGGVLHNLDIVTPSLEDRAGSLREQVLQMAWAGELEGWITAPPKWHLVAENATAAEWEPILRQGLEQEIQVVHPLAPAALAAATADRAAHAEPETNLLPPEYTTRYQQQFVDRLWMRALGTVVVLYLIGFAIYMVAVQFALFRTRIVERDVATLAPQYTNAMQLKAQYQVLKDRQELKFAALDTWKAVAEWLPESLSLDGFTFTEGRRLMLQGTAPLGQVQQIYKFDGDLRKVATNGQQLFDPLKGESPSYHQAPGGASLSWSLVLELKRSEVQ